MAFKMLSLLLFPLFASVVTPVALESQPLAKHPSVDTLNVFSTQVGSLAEEVTNWSGRPERFDTIIRHAKEAVNTLHTATTQMLQTENIDYLSSGLGFASVGLTIASKAHSFTSAVMAKAPAIKAVKQEQPMFYVLDDAYREVTAFFAASKEKMPTVVYSLLKYFHTELLGTISEAREAYRPKEEIIVIVVPGKDGAPPSTYTLPQGASMQTTYPAAPSPSPLPQNRPMYSPQNYGPPLGYQPQQQQQQQQQNQPQYTMYTPRFTQAPNQGQYTPFAPQYQVASQASRVPLRTQASGGGPNPKGYVW